MASGITFPAGINGDASIVGGVEGAIGNFTEYALPPNWNGNFTTYSYSGDSTFINGINNNGDEVGGYFGQNGYAFGLLLSSSGIPTSFQYPGSNYTYAWGINDFGQIVGYYTDSNGVDHGFLATPK